MTREQFIRDLLNIGVPYSTIDAILQFSGNQANPTAYDALQELTRSQRPPDVA